MSDHQIEQTPPELGITVAFGSSALAQIIANYHPGTAPEGVRGLRVVLRTLDGGIIDYRDGFYKPNGEQLPHHHEEGRTKHTNLPLMQGLSSEEVVLWYLGDVVKTNAALARMGAGPVTESDCNRFCGFVKFVLSFKPRLVEGPRPEQVT